VRAVSGARRIGPLVDALPRTGRATHITSRNPASPIALISRPDCPVMRELFRECAEATLVLGSASRVIQACTDCRETAMVTERLQVDVMHRLSVARTSFAKFHARRLGTPPPSSHPVWRPKDAR
jgi:hypothetical protein